jgi:acetyl esterase/lipase
MRFALLVSVGSFLAAVAGADVERDVEYGQAAGESLKLDVSVPDGPGPFPAVILVHGGGWVTGDKSGGPRKAFIAPLHEPLERAGFAWFSINYRLAPAHRHPACIQDVETAIRWVKANAARYRIDPRRIALSGESAGGHLAALAAVRADETTRLAAVVPFYGVFDMTAMVTPGEPMRKNFVALFDRPTADARALELLREASPLFQVKAGLPPFLLVHGTADTTVPLEQSERFHARLRESGEESELMTIPNGVHGMISWNTVAPDYADRVVAWLQRTLAADRPPKKAP